MAKSKIQTSREAIEAIRSADLDNVQSIVLSYTKAGEVAPAKYTVTRGEDCLSGTNWELQVFEQTLKSGETFLYLQGLVHKKNSEVVLEKRQFRLSMDNVASAKIITK